MKQTYKSLIFIFLYSIIPFFLGAQQVNTIYFMENVPFRHNLNPAFQPISYYYLSLPYVGHTQIDVRNNSLTLKDVIYNYNGQTIYFLNPAGGNTQQFYNTLKPTTVIHASGQTNLLSFGFKHKTAFWSFSLTKKIDDNVSVPKDLIRFLLFGTPDITNNSFDFTGFQTDASAYTESAVGYATKLNKKWSAGLKLKMLFGYENISNTNNVLLLNAGIDKWTLKVSEIINMSGPNKVQKGDSSIPLSFKYPTALTILTKPLGMGAGIDLGITYNPISNLTLSVAILDLSFIRWNTNIKNINYNIDYSFDGIGQIDSVKNFDKFKTVFDRITTGNTLVDSLSKAFQSANNLEKTKKAYTTFIPTKLNLGAEYSIIDNFLSLGLLSRTIFYKKIITEEITASVNARPVNWLNATLSYSILGGQIKTLGAGLGIRSGFIHWFISGDYLAYQKANLSLKEFNPNNWDVNIPIPYNTKNFNLSVGMNLVLDQIKPLNGLHQIKRKQDCHCFK